MVPEGGAAAQSGSAVPFAYSVASRSEQVPSPACVSSPVVFTVTVVAAKADAARMAVSENPPSTAAATAAAQIKVIGRLSTINSRT